jgi:hypothetical protein
MNNITRYVFNDYNHRDRTTILPLGLGSKSDALMGTTNRGEFRNYISHMEGTNPYCLSHLFLNTIAYYQNLSAVSLLNKQASRSMFSPGDLDILLTPAVVPI